MAMELQAESEVRIGVADVLRDPRLLIRGARSNLEIWANLIVILWAVAFMLWQGDRLRRHHRYCFCHLGDTRR